MDIKKIKQLREETSVSVAQITKALNEAEHDLDKARDLLKKWGVEVAAKKSGREVGEGVVTSYVHHNKRMAAIVKLNCETDFVAKNAEFQKLAFEIAMQVASMNPKNVEELLTQPYIRDNSKTIDMLIKEHIAKIGENIKVGEFIRMAI